jgi:beta-glucosidase
VLLGRVNPSGKLAETFPRRLEDTPAYLSFPDDGAGRVPFTEGLFAGYRWYDARRIEPGFPFGHGLSYTSFAYGELRVDRTTLRDSETLTATLPVRNTGARAGREVVQLYVRERQPRLQRPEQELRAFAKVALAPGEEREVRFELGGRDFAVYDSRAGAWTVNGGEYDLLVGASSRDIRARASVTLEATAARPAPLGRLSPLRDWLANPAARPRVLAAIGTLQREIFGAETDPTAMVPGSGDVTHSFVTDMPIAKLVVFGALSEGDLAGLIAAANGGGQGAG